MAADPASADAREPSVRAHETREFANAVEYTVQVTFVVAGGARWRTGYTRARKVAVRLANTAARAKGVVEVRAVAGASHDGELIAPERVCFEAANSGHATTADPANLDRFLDPDHERGLVSLAEARAAAHARQRADRDRRQAVGCANPTRLPAGVGRACNCVYCQPAIHLTGQLRGLGQAGAAAVERCLCGRDLDSRRAGCRSHRDHELVVLDGDLRALSRLAALHGRHVLPPLPGRAQTAERDGPDLPPPGR